MQLGCKIWEILFYQIHILKYVQKCLTYLKNYKLATQRLSKLNLFLV